MRAHIIKNGKVANTIEVQSLDFMPGLIDADQHGGAIGDLWDGQTFSKPAALVVVPELVTMRQFRAALVELDLDESVDTFVASVPGKDGRRARADYASATEVRRDWPLLVSMAAAMGKTPADIDAVMTLAATL